MTRLAWAAALLLAAAGLLQLQGEDSAPAQATTPDCVIDATVRTVTAKDSTTLYTVDRNGRREHFTVDPIILDITNVGDHYSTSTDCTKE